MIKNIGKTDKIIRIIIGIAIIGAGIYFKSWWGLLGILPLITASISWCPVYVPFKISTIRKKK